jgi:TPR repeat protein
MNSLMKIRKLPAVFAAALLALSAGAGADEQPGETDPFEQGMEAYNRGDLPGALPYFREAAEAGSDEAQVWLAYLLDYSEQNEESVRWYRAAAEQGNLDGVAGLAEMYAKGDGVEKDLDKARELYIEAGEAGHEASIRVLISAYAGGGLGVQQDVERLAYWKARQADLPQQDDDGS